jgi:UDP-N-acetyl-D-mannosaminuronate dehydrogenase
MKERTMISVQDFASIINIASAQTYRSCFEVICPRLLKILNKKQVHMSIRLSEAVKMLADTFLDVNVLLAQPRVAMYKLC